ncbi:MAG: hypothetical protein CL910_16415 [Deltaproteobacteria bacterium]|nr:hypothetical protein [Deltaproteobacteria bacterium]
MRSRGTPVLFLAGLLACGQQDSPAPQATERAKGSDPSAGEVEAVGAPNAKPEIVEQLRADLVVERHPSDGGGSARWDTADGRAPEVAASESVTLPIRFEVGPGGIAVGGRLFLYVPPFWGWSPIQLRGPLSPGYTVFETTAEGVTLEPQTLDAHLVAVRIGGRAMEAGEQIRLVYGAGPGGSRADRFAEREAPFALAVDGDGDGVSAHLAEPLRLDVKPGPARGLIAHAPSVVRPGHSFTVRVCALDARANAGVALRGPFAAQLEGPGRTPVSGQLGEGGCGSVEIEAEGTGLMRVHAFGPEDLEAISNPIWVDAEAPRVLWADLHGHSHLSDGTGTPEDFYRYARDVAALDIAALTDHDHWGLPFLDASPEAWERIVAAARRFHAPGRFVTLVGYEWTSWIYGHRHVLYFRDRGPLHSSIDEETDHPEELWGALRGEPALTFAHHSAGEPIATDWRIPPDPEFEPVTEIVSVHGSSESRDTVLPVRGLRKEHTIRAALGRGYRLGFVGSGDSHDGHPGLAHLAGSSGGLAAILSEDLSREGLLAALRARRSYATNGPRMIVHVTLDGHPVGSALTAGAEHRLRIRAVGSAPLAGVEVVLGGEVLGNLLEEPSDGIDIETVVRSPEPGSHLYVRVRQEQGGAAWTSPFFFDEP